MSSSNQDIDDFFDNSPRSQSKTSIFHMSNKSDISEDESNVNSKNNLARTWSRSSNNKDASASDTDSHTSSFSSYSDSSNYDSEDNQTARYESSLDTRKNDCSPTKKVMDDIWTTRKRVQSRSRSRSTSGSESSAVTMSDVSGVTMSDDSDVTDISPLNSPCVISAKVNQRSGHHISPRTHSHSPRHNSHTADETRRGSPAMNLLNARSDKMDLRLLMEAVAEMDKQSDDNVVYFHPKGKNASQESRQNLSFRRDKVKEINKENRRLLQKILNYAKRSESNNSVTATQAGRSPTSPSTVNQLRQQRSTAVAKSHLTPSSVNRGKDQRRIETDNKNLFKRIQSAKATSTLRRDSLLNDYNNMQIGGVSLSSVHQTSLSKHRHRPSSRTDYSRSSSRPISATYAMNSRSSSRPTSATYAMNSCSSSRPTSGTLHRPSSATVTSGAMRSSMAKKRPTSAMMHRYGRERIGVQVAWEDGW